MGCVYALLICEVNSVTIAFQICHILFDFRSKIKLLNPKQM